MSPAPALGFATPGLRSANLVVITQDVPGHSASVAHALAACLRAHGVQVQVIEGHDVPDDAEAVICLQGLRALALPEEGVPSAEALAHAAALNHDLFRVARAVAPRFSARGGTFVTVQDTGGDFGLSGSPRAWIASAAALARTAAVEWPACTVRAIDLAREGRSPEALAAALAHELLFGAPEPEVGLRANGERLRVTLNARAAAPGPTAPAIDGALDFVVATGGARGVTAACVLELARAGRGRFLLLGRTPLEAEPACCAGALSDAALKRALLDEARARGEAMSPAALGRRADAVRAGREVRATLEAIRALGSEVAYAAVDATQAEALAAVLADHRRRFGPVTGVIHGAGVLADKLIAEKTDEQYERVVSTKVKGLAAVLAATPEDPLRFVFLFSSVAARSGNLGQSDYAMANEVLNKVAARLRHERPTCVVRALGWGPWEGGMVDEGLKARFARLGVALVPVEGGARALVDELRRGPGAAEILIGGPALPGTHAQHSLAGPSARPFEAELWLSRDTYPELDGHRIKGVPVVPVAWVLEWFARAAARVHPELTLAVLRHVKVLRGVRLFGFDEGRGERVRVRVRPLSEGEPGPTERLALELVSAEGAPLYTATCELRERPPGPGVAPLPSEGLAPAIRPLYGEPPLFHGQSFQMLRALDAHGPSGLTARTEGVAALGWSQSGPWHTDPGLVDAALQLALVFTHETLGGVSLPTGLDELCLHQTGAAPGTLRAILRSHLRSSRDRCVCDVAFVNEAGVLVCEAKGVETHVIANAETPSLPKPVLPPV